MVKHESLAQGIQSKADPFVWLINRLKSWRKSRDLKKRTNSLPEAFRPFDPDFYLASYPDLVDAKVDPFDHWLNCGKDEGRIGVPSPFFIRGESTSFDPDKRTVLIVSHEATRTGAPILCLNILKRLRKSYNIVSLVLSGDVLIDDFVAFSQMTFYSLKFSAVGSVLLAKKALAQVKPDFAIVNSLASKSVLPVLAQSSIPTVSLVHEFASLQHPVSAMEEVIRHSTQLVFSASIILKDAQNHVPIWTPGERTHILPQGRCEMPGDEEADRIRNAFRPVGSPLDLRVVIGAGSVIYRKGVDLFLQCAQHILQSDRVQNVRFVWIGHGYNPEHDKGYSASLAEQVRQSGLEALIEFVGEVGSLAAAYREADLFLLTSRLDPLPNVGIDSISVGLPIVCFANASGIADILVEEGLAGECVAPHLDTAAMADLAVKILDDVGHKSRLKQRLISIGLRRFDMNRYVTEIIDLLEKAVSECNAEEIAICSVLKNGKLNGMSWKREIGRSKDQALAVRTFVREERAGLHNSTSAKKFLP